MRTFHGPFGDMWFHFRNDWPVRMWPSNSLTRSGYFWILLRGPYTGTWCWRPIGTCYLWVRMTSLWSRDLLWGISAFSLTVSWEPCFSWLSWKPCSLRHVRLHDWHQEVKLVFPSDDLPTVWYTRSFSRAWVFIKLISNFEISNSLFSTPVFLVQ